MRERAQAAEGSLELLGRAGAGTIVRCRVPATAGPIPVPTPPADDASPAAEDAADLPAAGAPAASQDRGIQPRS